VKAALLLVVTLGAILAIGVFTLASGWIALDVEIPAAGWWAIGVGGVLTVLLGVGLMALSFHSARHGYDDQVPRDDPQQD
jgi:hypothetical protein